MRVSHPLLIVGLALGCASNAARTPVGPVHIPLPEPPRPVSALVEELSAPDAPSRRSAAWALAGAGDVGAAVIEALMAALDDSSEPVREAATWALYHVDSPGFDRGQLTESPPKVLVQTRPQYPVFAYQKKIEGTVGVWLLINAVGQVAHAEVRESIPELDGAALACVRQWQFAPARRKGRPVSSVAVAPVGFRIY